MNPWSRMTLLVALVAAAAWTLPSRADDAGTMLLVAKRELRDRLYGSTILLARPIGNDRHVGFIVNKPTPTTLGKLFPGHAPSQKVVEPVYLGGPVSPDVIFALVNRSESPGGKSLKLAPDLYLAMESQVVDRIIEAEPDHARFLAGLVVWRPGELESELKRGLWYVLDARADVVLRKSEGLWEELVVRSERKENTI
jgi:putative transcriptional regulator